MFSWGQQTNQEEPEDPVTRHTRSGNVTAENQRKATERAEKRRKATEEKLKKRLENLDSELGESSRNTGSDSKRDERDAESDTGCKMERQPEITCSETDRKTRGRSKSRTMGNEEERQSKRRQLKGKERAQERGTESLKRTLQDADLGEVDPDIKITPKREENANKHRRAETETLVLGKI